MAIMILAHPIKCEEIAYIMGLDGKTAVGYANITGEDSGNEVSFTVAARGPSESHNSTRDVDDIMGEISTKVNRGNKTIREQGLDLVSNRSGAQTIDQIRSIYDYMVGNWTYVSDWKSLDEFQYSNYTLDRGIKVGSSGQGDCDDFAILLASLIESIGGTPRVIFAYSPHGGHAYTEVYLGKKNDRDVERMLRWLRTAYNVSDLCIHEDPGNEDVWLNMDWWKEKGGAEHPGGPFYQATYQKPMYIRDEDKTPLTPIENLLPAAKFSWTPLEPRVDEVVSFCADQSHDPDGKITNYEWDFGDEGTGKGPTKSTYRHIYPESGRYQVNLTVTDNEGDTGNETREIIISETPPEAIFTFSPAEPVVGEAIAFNASQSKDKRGEIIEYKWNFGDGYSGEGVSINHPYWHPYWESRTYNVKLTVTNDKGVKNSSFINVDVSQSEKKTIVEEPEAEPPFVEPEPATPINESELEIWSQDDLDGTSEPGDNFGWSVAAGDFNNDGWDDLAIGVPKENIIGTENEGVVNVLYGSSGGLEKNHWPIWYETLAKGAGTEKGDSFGWSLAAGDFDGDGCEDLAIGVPNETVGGEAKAGAMFVLYGSKSGGLQKERSKLWYQKLWYQKGIDWDDSEINDAFGWSLAAGDFNNDGNEDLAIGVPGETVMGKVKAGAVDVLYGSKPDGLGATHKLWHQDLGVGGSSEIDDRFGESVAAGDFDQDGFDDLAIKVPGEAKGYGPGRGALNFLFGSYGGLTNEAPPSDYQSPSNAVWLKTVAAGDFNGDGKEDQAIGMPASNNGAGEVEVRYGV